MTESPRPDLDEAIDRVAARLVEVPGDDHFLSRTIEQLPERSVTPWFLTMPVQATLAAALALLAFVYVRPDVATPDEPRLAVTLASPGSTRPNEEAVPPVPDPRSPISDPRPPIPDPRSPIPDRPDHEHSLAPVDTIDALELVGIAPPAMELDATAAPESLVLPELALDPKGDS